MNYIYMYVLTHSTDNCSLQKRKTKTIQAHLEKHHSDAEAGYASLTWTVKIIDNTTYSEEWKAVEE